MRRALRNLAIRVPGLRALYRTVGHWRYNTVDFLDSYVIPSLKPRFCPLGFVFVGLHSQHHRAMQNGTFEPEEVKLLSAVLQKVELFIDVGANVGYFTCLARKFGVAAIAIEPMQRNLSLLLQNLTLNDWQDTEVIASGVSDAIGIVKMFGASSTGASLINNWAGAQTSISRHIPVSTLDTLIGERFSDRRILVKMDVEGHEYRALVGARKLISRAIKPIWLIEITGNQFHPGGTNPHFEETFALLRNHGYQTLALTSDGPRSIDHSCIGAAGAPDQTDPTVINYLFVPGDIGSLLGSERI
jgi:FkbM family methyltransferase